MLTFILRRTVQLIPLVIAISVIIFGVIQLPPGDYLTTYIQQLELSGTEVAEGTIESLRRQYALDQPPVIQYFRWVSNIVFRGDLGRSFMWQRPVREVIGDRIGMSMMVSLISIAFSWLIAIPIGIYSATHQYSVPDYIFTFFGFIGIAVPGFLLALLLVYGIFSMTGISLTGLFPPEFQGAPWSWAKFVSMLPRLWMPVIVIGAAPMAGLIRVTRGMMLDELSKQYVITARAKGVEERRLLLKYPIRMAINPLVSTIGWLLPAVISSEIIVSVVLNLPTTGPMLLRALLSQDMYLAGSFLLITSVLTVIGTLLSDILLAILDPRIRFGGVSE